MSGEVTVTVTEVSATVEVAGGPTVSVPVPSVSVVSDVTPAVSAQSSADMVRALFNRIYLGAF
ncbi:hypothetical protein D3C83_154010 [compost metagenome]